MSFLTAIPGKTWYVSPNGVDNLNSNNGQNPNNTLKTYIMRLIQHGILETLYMSEEENIPIRIMGQVVWIIMLLLV